MRDHHVTALAVGLLLTCTGLSPAPPDHVGLLLGRPPPPPRCTAFLTSRAIWWWHFRWPVSAQIPAERRLNRSVLDSSVVTSPPDTTLRMGSPKLKAGNENVLGLRPLCLWGREDLDRIRDLGRRSPRSPPPQPPTPLCRAQRSPPILPPSPQTQHREEENTTGRVDGRQNSYSLLMGGRVGARDWA